MGNIIDLTSTTSLYTGSWYPYANTAGSTFVNTMQPELTGSWGGLASTWGAVEVLAAASASLQASGSWKGVAYSLATTVLASASFDRDTTTKVGSANVNQSLGQAGWDPFPIPTVEPEEPPAQRDVTRFRKSYSSQRMQPRPVILRRS